MSNNAFEKTSADMSFCNVTRMFVVTLTFFTYLHKIDVFNQSFISSAAVDLGVTGNVWRKPQPVESSYLWKGSDCGENLLMSDRVPAMLVCAPSYTHPTVFFYNFVAVSPLLKFWVLLRSPSIVRVIKSRRLRSAGHVARMEEGRSALKILTYRKETFGEA